MLAYKSSLLTLLSQVLYGLMRCGGGGVVKPTVYNTEEVYICMYTVIAYRVLGLTMFVQLTGEYILYDPCPMAVLSIKSIATHDCL